MLTILFQDLEDMGIVRLGHQKKILLAIKRVKDIRAGKRSISNQGSLDFTRIQPGQVSTIGKLPLHSPPSDVRISLSMLYQ